MKKLAFALFAVSALLFGVGTVASAQTYSPTLTLSPNPPALGAPFSVTLTNCVIGETVTFAQPQSTPPSIAVTCAAVSGAVTGPGLGQATASFAAGPTVPGTYSVTAVGSSSGTLSASLTPAQVTTTTVVTTPATPAGGLPATGSGGISTTTSLAIGLLVVGIGLFVVARMRRRQPKPA